MIDSGAHLGAVRRWMQSTFPNGERVTWGSYDVLGASGITVFAMEELAQEIKEALFREYKIKDRDHVYMYTIFCDGGPEAFQYADTPAEIWACLFKAEGRVQVLAGPRYDANNVALFEGTAEEARRWVRDKRVW